MALVTGGVGGIGSAICRELLSRGIQVAAGYYPPERDLAIDWQSGMDSDGYTIHIFAGDVADFASTGKMLEEVRSQLGHIDILVNCAGITRDKTLKKMSPKQWDEVIQTNLGSAFNVTQQLIGEMVERGYGRIVNISSVNGQCGQFGQANYSAAKAGLHGFTMAVAKETALNGVTVNTISPGYIATTMTQSMDQNHLDNVAKSIPMRQIGKPEDVANAVAWLVDDKTSYVTGANIPVNGGLFMAA